MSPQDFLKTAVNKISRGRPLPGTLKATFQGLSQHNPTVANESIAFKAAQSSPTINLNQQLIKESLLPAQAESAANEYLRSVVNTAVKHAASTKTPIKNALKNAIRSTSIKNYTGNAPQGAGALTQVAQVVNEPLFQTLTDPESPLGFSQVEALINYHQK